MSKYKYFPPSKIAHEFKKCEYCPIEKWINKNNRFCSRDCWYKFRTGNNSLEESPWDLHPIGDRVKDYDSKWEYIQADSERLKNHNDRGSRDKRKVRQWLADYKIERGCIDCGFSTHFAALQLDHTGPKTASISELRSSIKRMQEEIEKGKCVVRCANCHSIKTWCDKNGVEYDPKNYR